MQTKQPMHDSEIPNPETQLQQNENKNETEVTARMNRHSREQVKNSNRENIIHLSK